LRGLRQGTFWRHISGTEIGQISDKISEAASVDFCEASQDVKRWRMATIRPSLPVGNVLEALLILRPAGIPGVADIILAPRVRDSHSSPSVEAELSA